MKKTLLLLLVVFSIQIFSQNIPCEFSWKNAPTTDGNKNYITSVSRQPYQGPCLSFAFIAAIESKYAIENNINNPSLKLSEAYLDYKVWSSNFNIYKTVLEYGFKIPIKNGINDTLNTFPPFCDNEFDCHFLTQTRNCINHSQGEKNYSFNIVEVNNSLQVDGNDPVTCQGAIGNFMTVNNVIRLSNINSNDDLKLKLLNEGPIIVKVNGLNNLNKFRNYDTNVQDVFHAFIIIGWTNDSRWIIKDSWPTMSGIVETKPNINILSLINSGNIELYQVSGISYNGNPTSQNPATLKLPECQLSLELSPIHLVIDYVFIEGYMYHKFWVNSNVSVDTWRWGIDYPNGFLKRDQVNMPYYSSVLLSPTSSGTVTIFVNGYKNGVKVTKEKKIYLSNWHTTRTNNNSR